MTDAEMYRSLVRLSEVERGGLAYYRTHKEPMSYLAYIRSLSPANLLRYREQLSHDYSPEVADRLLDMGKPEPSDTIPTFYVSRPKTIQIQQLQRYIRIPPHSHDFFELVFVLGGTCTHVIGENSFVHTVGDFTIIPPGITHYLEANGNCVCLTAKATVETFVRLFFGILRENSILSGYLDQSQRQPWFRCAVTLHAKDDPEFRHILLRLYDQQESAEPYAEALIEALFRALIAYILQKYGDTAIFLVSDAVRQKQTIEILSYIFQNYRTVTLQSAADRFHFNMSYLSTRLKELTGQSFSMLVKDYRMQVACRLLKETDLPVYEICEQVGYSNPSQFVRSFRVRYGVTPIRFREQEQSV